MTSTQLFIIITFIYISIFSFTKAQHTYPVPVIPNGRVAIHAFVVLPIDQEVPTDPDTPVGSWIVHFPSFGVDSPHNFQLVLKGNLLPLETVNNDTQVLSLPYPPSSPLLYGDFQIAPPTTFSLNNVLLQTTTEILGILTNGSDTIAISKFEIGEISTAVYINDSRSVIPLKQQQFYSYPRSVVASDVFHLYLSHQIVAAPDFFQVIHVQVAMDGCSCVNCDSVEEALLTEGLVWIFPNTVNDVTHRFGVSAAILGTTQSGNGSVTCKMVVLEEVNCSLGPLFLDNC